MDNGHYNISWYPLGVAEVSDYDVNGEPQILINMKELQSKASRLGSNLRNYLGKTKEDSFENIIEYVGADGKYVSITKSVKIYYPKEYLKGVEIVDTPGFNDPIVSREERTKEFLKKADVVLMMLYAGRPFDATDRDIIFKNVSQCGIGKVLIGINKYDIPYCSDETLLRNEPPGAAGAEGKPEGGIQRLSEAEALLKYGPGQAQPGAAEPLHGHDGCAQQRQRPDL